MVTEFNFFPQFHFHFHVYLVTPILELGRGSQNAIFNPFLARVFIPAPPAMEKMRVILIKNYYSSFHFAAVRHLNSIMDASFYIIPYDRLYVDGYLYKFQF